MPQDRKLAQRYITIVSMNWSEYSDAERKSITCANDHLVACIPEGRLSFKLIGVDAAKQGTLVKYLETISNTELAILIQANEVVSASIEIPEGFSVDKPIDESESIASKKARASGSDVQASRGQPWTERT